MNPDEVLKLYERGDEYRSAQAPGTGNDEFEYILNASYLTTTRRVLNEWRANRILLVVSKTLDATTSVVSDLENLLGKERVVSKKQGVGSHSPYADVIDIAHRVQDLAVDSVVSVGSGSYSDACKTAVILAETLPPKFTQSDMEALVDPQKGVTDAEKMKPPRAKLICIPTSLSAGEWNNKASATNESGKKQHFGHAKGFPRMIILDPKFASTTPNSIWLSSGIRAIDHCIEAICNPNCQPHTAERSLHGLQALVLGLSQYREAKNAHCMKNAGVDDDDNARRRKELELGILNCFVGSRQAIMGYVLDRNTFGPSHAIGHQLGSVGQVQHGVTSCIVLGPVLRFTAERDRTAATTTTTTTLAAAQTKILNVFNDTLEWNETSAADAFERLVRTLGLPCKLSDVDVTRPEQLDRIADLTLTDIVGKGIGSLDKREILRVLELAM